MMPETQPFRFPPQLPSLFFRPIRYRPNGIGYWSGHIPFACDLVATLRPGTLVELGTHMGESYFAFCQAIAEQEIACKAFAVDTWEGDQHTGAYDDSVYEQVLAHNQERYGQYSVLLRMTFDEAAERFAEQSIDLLHIDGAHTYTAVQHDFLRWWPKVRSGGVVLLHDAAERQESFGVWRVLEELRQSGILTAEFVHSHGLAVLVKTPITGDEHVGAAFVTADDKLRLQMRSYYEVCAGNLHDQFLVQKQMRPAEWEITSQLFWRGAEQGFEEQSSVRHAHVIGESPTEVEMRVPQFTGTYVAFRLILSLVPAALRLFRIQVSDVDESILWKREEAAGVLFLGRDAAMFALDLQLPIAVNARVSSGGGRFGFSVTGVDPMMMDSV